MIDKKRKRGRPRKGEHGVYRFKESGILPADHKDLKTQLDRVRENIINDLGGLSTLSQAQLILIDQTVNLIGCRVLIESWVSEKGVFTQSGRLTPVLANSYLGFCANIQRSLRELGLERKADKGNTLKDYIQSKQKGEKT